MNDHDLKDFLVKDKTSFAHFLDAQNSNKLTQLFQRFFCAVGNAKTDYHLFIQRNKGLEITKE